MTAEHIELCTHESRTYLLQCDAMRCDATRQEETTTNVEARGHGGGVRPDDDGRLE